MALTSAITKTALATVITRDRNHAAAGAKVPNCAANMSSTHAEQAIREPSSPYTLASMVQLPLLMPTNGITSKASTIMPAKNAST